MRRVLLGILLLLVFIVTFAFVRPLTVLWFATQTRLLLEGIHSNYTDISYAGNPHVRIHYYAGGSGSPVVLVHGLGGRAEDWANLMPQLVRDHHRVYALDLPGYGRSDWPPNAAYSIAEESGAVEAFLDNRHLAQTDLAGWSMGDGSPCVSPSISRSASVASPSSTVPARASRSPGIRPSSSPTPRPS
jgi:hypothetical protein